uniref:Secreted protein n=1 Tax=Globodera pallida TaxID=36090 RepID=A0A183CEA9_GLOPA
MAMAHYISAIVGPVLSILHNQFASPFLLNFQFRFSSHNDRHNPVCTACSSRSCPLRPAPCATVATVTVEVAAAVVAPCNSRSACRLPLPLRAAAVVEAVVAAEVAAEVVEAAVAVAAEVAGAVAPSNLALAARLPLPLHAAAGADAVAAGVADAVADAESVWLSSSALLPAASE